MKYWKSIALVSGMTLALSACGNQKNAELRLTDSGLNPADFVTTVDDKTTALYTLKNANGMEVCITNFGGRIVSVMAPDRNGKFHDVVLGFDSISDYLPQNNKSDFGAAIGRYANRINGGKIVLNGDTIQLPKTTSATASTAVRQAGSIKSTT